MKKTAMGNVILDYEWGMISYNGDIEKTLKDNTNDIGIVAQEFGTSIGMETKKMETALYTKKDGAWRILNGDFRKQYEKCKTLAEMIKFYEDNKKYKSDWSTK